MTPPSMVSHPHNPATASASESRDLTLRRAPSITSTRTALTHRRHHHHRHARSHTGGSSYQPQNEFPIFTHTGDVEIVLSDREGRRESRFLLHRLILAQCSGFFEAGTSEEWSSSGQANAGGQAERGEGSMRRSEERPIRGDEVVLGGQRKRWRYELDWGSGADDIPMLVQKAAGARSIFGGDPSARPPPPQNKPNPPSSGFFRSMANYSALQVSSTNQSHPSRHTEADDLYPDLVLSYSNLFRIFYNHPPALDNTNIANAYVECKALLNLADLYDALSVIGPRVDHHLMGFHGRLWKQIAKYPPSYLKLGYLARSKAIYSEALIHVVGQWPAGAPQLRGQVPQALWELIEDKVAELHDVTTRVESRLFRLTLTTPRGDRVNPHSAWLDWLAVSLFRHWILENTTPPPAGILKSGASPNLPARPPSNASNTRSHASSRSIFGHRHRNSSSTRAPAAAAPPAPSAPPPPFNIANTYSLLAAGGSSYLPHAEVKAFLKLHPDTYSRDNLRRFERRIEELKNLAREVVRPLGRCWLEGEPPVPGAGDGERGWGWGYLVCVKVCDGDWVWEEE